MISQMPNARSAIRAGVPSQDGSTAFSDVAEVSAAARPIPDDSPKHRPLLFVDFHGTISGQRFWSTLPPDKLAIIQDRLFADVAFVEAWMRGQNTSRDACRYGSRLTGIGEEHLFEELLRSCLRFELDDSIRATLLEVRTRWKTVLITANMDCFWVIAKKLELTTLFDAIVVSSDFGLLKEDEDGLLFRKVATRLGGDLAEARLLDDSEIVCAVFEGLGGQAHRVQTPATFVQQLTEALP